MCYNTTVYRCYSYLFWSDGTGSNAKIERSDLSGNNRIVLVTSAEGLVSPTTLVVDFSTQKVYWLDSAAQKIGHVNFDGLQRSIKTISILSQVSAMTIYRVRTFWTHAVSFEWLMLNNIDHQIIHLPRVYWQWPVPYRDRCNNAYSNLRRRKLVKSIVAHHHHYVIICIGL